jgi:hypothetical protein
VWNLVKERINAGVFLCFLVCVYAYVAFHDTWDWCESYNLRS